MPETAPKVLIISRDSLLEILESAKSDSVFRKLAKIARQGHHLLLTASAPDHWLPTRGDVDSALDQQNTLQKELAGQGGDLDGVYYVPRSLFTQDRNREGALKDILGRYSVDAEQAVLLSSSTPFIKAAKRLNILTHSLASEEGGPQAIENALDILFAR